jgi:hypothetical protein
VGFVVVILWFLRGEMRGEDGQEAARFWRENLSHFSELFFLGFLAEKWG